MSEIRYLYISDTAESEPPLQNGEGIMVIDAEGAYYISALISNELYNSDIYAPEINWYLKHTQADAEEKKDVFKKLYEIRYLRYKHTLIKKHSLEIERSVAIIGEKEEDFEFVTYAKRFFEVEHILPSNFHSIEGSLGAFTINYEVFNEEAQKKEQRQSSVAQVIFCDAESIAVKQMGVESLQDDETEVLIKRFRNRIGWYEYDESVKFNPSLCLYQHRENPTCKSCLDICPTKGLTFDASAKEIHFSHLDCIDCGICVSVCPNDALDFTHFTKDAFNEVASLCENQKVFIISEKNLKKIEKIAIPKGFIPLVVETEQFLTKFHLLTLLEHNALSLLLYIPNITDITKQAVDFVNASQEREEKVFIAKDKKELEEIFMLLCSNDLEQTEG
jgi:ferredoxin